jgi:hypothetical protein
MPVAIIALALLAAAIALWPRPVGRLIVAEGPALECTVPLTSGQSSTAERRGSSSAASTATHSPEPTDAGTSGELQATIGLPDASLAARVAAITGWSCEVVPAP